MAELYTPFMEQVGSTLGRGMMQREQNKLAQSAYMGDQDALGQLMGVNPELANKIQSGKATQQQNKLMAAQKSEDRTRKISGENQKILQDIFTNAVKFETFEEASAYADGETAKQRDILGDMPPFTQEAYEQGKQISGADKKTGMASAKTEIFADGSVLTVLPSGETEFTDKSGKVLEGDARLKGMQEAFDSESLLAGAKKAATQAIDKSGEMFTKLEPINVSINNIEESITAIDEGADTGFIMSKLPSIRESSIKLDNLQKRMGLDVVGMTTFGALSKGELDVAMSTALPTTLKPKELKKWLIRKRDAQQKLSDYITEAAVFLGTPGNTIKDFIELNKTREKDASNPKLKELHDLKIKYGIK